MTDHQITPDLTADELADADDLRIHAIAREIIAETATQSTDALDERVTGWVTTTIKQTAVTVTDQTDREHTVLVTTQQTPHSSPETTAAAIQVEAENDVLTVALPLDHPLAQTAAALAADERDQWPQR